MAKQVKSPKSKGKKSKLIKKKPIVNGNSNSKGQFAKGNQAAKGNKNKQHKKAMDFKAIFQSAITEADMLAIAKKMVQLAKKGDVKATKEILDRCMGKSVQPLEVAGKDGGPITVQIINYAGASQK